jgi:hypothetical protein
MVSSGVVGFGSVVVDGSDVVVVCGGAGACVLVGVGAVEVDAMIVEVVAWMVLVGAMVVASAAG